MPRQIKAAWIFFALAVSSLAVMAAGGGPFGAHLPLVLRNDAPPAVVVLPNSSWYQAGASTVRIIGEVQNNGVQTVTFVLVTVNLFDASGQVVETEQAYAYLDLLPPGQRTCFNLQLPKPASWSRYEFETPTFVATSSTSPALTTYNVSSAINQVGWYEISGFVRNDDSVQVIGAEVIATLRSANGTALDCDTTFANTSTLNPGQSSAFRNTFTRRDDYSDVASFRVQTDGDRQ